MQVLVTGATGFVGSHTTAAVLAAGHQVRVLVRSAARAAAILEPRGITPDEIVIGDITDAAAVRAAVAGCDAVVHTAALVAIDSRRSAEIFATNSTGARLVISSALEAGAGRVVYLSSISALFPSVDPVLSATSAVAAPRSAYGASKAEAEHAVRALQDGGAPVTTFYPGGIHGPDDPGPTEITKALALWLKLGIPRTSGGYLLIDVRDLAAAITASLTEGRPGGRYLAGGHFLDWPQVIALARAVTGHPIRSMPVPGSLLRAAGRAGDLVARVRPSELPLTYEAMEMVTRAVPTDDAPVAADLGVTWRPAQETLRDCYRWLLAEGLVDARSVPALA